MSATGSLWGGVADFINDVNKSGFIIGSIGLVMAVGVGAALTPATLAYDVGKGCVNAGKYVANRLFRSIKSQLVKPKSDSSVLVTSMQGHEKARATPEVAAVSPQVHEMPETKQSPKLTFESLVEKMKKSSYIPEYPGDGKGVHYEKARDSAVTLMEGFSNEKKQMITNALGALKPEKHKSFLQGFKERMKSGIEHLADSFRSQTMALLTK